MGPTAGVTSWDSSAVCSHGPGHESSRGDSDTKACVSQRQPPSALFFLFWQQEGSRALSYLLLPNYVSCHCMVQHNHQYLIRVSAAAPWDHHNHHICLQLDAKPHYKFLPKSAILTAVMQNITQENGARVLTDRPGHSHSMKRLLIQLNAREGHQHLSLKLLTALANATSKKSWHFCVHRFHFTP